MSNSYQTLYRKWRPMTFEDVVGQKHVSDTLKNAIATGRISHAYLFCGTRGTGKTSTAKIFSRAVNCENPQSGEPCNECATCRGILDGSILDVYEMDAASNRGVENIRDIRDEVIYTPAGCTYKVYIIDEVHMLTEVAFNALLKTLEEPPKHALFILATTDPHKIPQTVLSRCQRFDFRRIGVEDIAGRLSHIANEEGIGIDEDALQMVAQLGDGSMRDALSLLDQCAAFGYETLSCDLVTEIVGMADPKVLFSIGDAVAEGDTKEALSLADGVLRQGKEVQNFLEELTLYFRNLLLVKSVQDAADLMECSQETAERYQRQGERFSVEDLLYFIQVLSEGVSQAKWMTLPQVAAEVAIIKLCNKNYSDETSALLARIENMERQLSQGATIKAPETATKKEEAPKVEEEKKEDTPPWEEVAEEPSKPPVRTTEKGEGWDLWPDALQEVKKESKLLYAFLSNAKAFLVEDTVEIELSNQVAYDRIATPGGLEYLEKLFSSVAKTPLRVQAYLEGERPQKEKKASIFDLVQKKETMGDTIHVID